LNVAILVKAIFRIRISGQKSLFSDCCNDHFNLAMHPHLQELIEKAYKPVTLYVAFSLLTAVDNATVG
jgi:hypothetical protein